MKVSALQAATFLKNSQEQLTQRSIHFLQDLLQHSLPANTPIYLYGSRANASNRWNSDFDLWIDRPMTTAQISALIDVIDASFVPFHVDIVSSPLKAGYFEQQVKQSVVRWM